MYVDDNINYKNEIIREIKVSKEYQPNSSNMDLLMKRYTIWKDLYTSNKKKIF